MVVRKQKRSRKYLGSRRWGVGNIKNARGKGDRGGVGRAGARKHKFTYMTSKARDEMHKHGFHPWKRSRLDEINLMQVSSMSAGKSEIELRNYKVLSNGTLSSPIKIRASKFSKAAMEKIKAAGGEAIIIE
ncbi:MAG: uL15 family ribosomal protein [Candidatus Marsarchaeota archaeon]|jgi:large subunit ribosomal protein L15|nr:uL15 family ribosomal protein [Candidatus Marsarchaeota archaeon]MCL5111349.1 uL15 family ribosomal protein [Candidatus Marsarchaeota archaeon]